MDELVPSFERPPWWVPVLVGLGLVVIPDPATTATGLAILAATYGAYVHWE